ncbi:hypothetical protein D3C83_110340 [compost metagenome]
MTRALATALIGNSLPLRLAAVIGRLLRPKVMKWFCHAASLPSALIAALNEWKPPGR